MDRWERPWKKKDQIMQILNEKGLSYLNTRLNKSFSISQFTAALYYFKLTIILEVHNFSWYKHW